MVLNPQKKCLIVEVDTSWQGTISRTLQDIRDIQLEIDVAYDFWTAVEKIRAAKFDLMTLDVSLDPEKIYKHGKKVLSILKSSEGRIPPTIIVSGSGDFEDVLDFLNNYKDCVLLFSPKQSFFDLHPREQFLAVARKAFQSSQHEALVEAPKSSVKPKIFVSHGPPTQALQDLQAFIEALGMEAVIAESKPKKGRSVVKHVESQWRDCRAAVILMTKVARVNKEDWTSRSVMVEIGALREHFRKNDEEFVIYLLERGVLPGAMVAEKVHETFTQGNMGAAFIHVARELKAFGLL